MRRQFIHEDFLLETEQARELYHRFAEPLPIIDYHCHLSPKDLAENRHFENLAQIWLAGDHYKWRAMRTCGVDEKFITGTSSDWQKFEQWAATVPKTLRNPLYHWTHLELFHPFGIKGKLLGPTTARSIWNECNRKLATPGFSVQGILKRMNVEVVCTTDDPVDTLEYHRAIAGQKSMTTRVLPAFRADRAIAVEDPAAFRRYVELLEGSADLHIRTFRDFLEALRKRHDFFHGNGARVSDHGLEYLVDEHYTSSEIHAAFSRLRRGKSLDVLPAQQLKSAVLYELALMDHEKGWVQQFHLGALRNANARMVRTVGKDTGYDSIGDFAMARSLAGFLNRLDNENKLARTILYNLNPRDNEVFASMIGNFQDGSIEGKIQYGPAWWFLDQIDGMTRQLQALSSMGLLSRFVGMVTDSRSFLSYPRHEYFRRLLCNILGREMEKGLLPNDFGLVGGMVRDICYFNAIRYFRFPGIDGKHQAKTTLS